MVITFLISKISIDALAAQQMVMQYMEFTFMILFGLSQAVTVLSSQAFSEKKITVVKQILYSGLGIGVAIFLLITAIYYFFGTYLLSIDIPSMAKNRESLMEAALAIFVIVGLFQITETVRVILSSVLRAMNDSRMPFLISLLTLWGLGIPFIFLLKIYLGYGIQAMWYWLIAVSILGSILLSIRFKTMLKHNA
ncbi:MAG: hypothetical protein JKY13_03830 [Gammaproteobacteria bacterium]|nr:hypothetical protein [Gammaproteobacteria bacterium]